MLLHGLTSVMIGITLPEMIRSFDLTLSRGGLIVSAQNLGGLVAMAAGMTLADRVSKPAWILISVAVSGVLFGLIGASPAYLMLVGAFFLCGVAVRAVDVLLNAFTGDIFPAQRTRAMNLLHMFFSIGAFAGPVFARWILDLGLPWNAVYWISGGMFLAAAAVALIWRKEYVGLSVGAPGEEGPGAGDVRMADLSAAPAAGDNSDARVESTDRVAWGSVVVLGVILLFYAMHQLGTTSWLPLFLETVRGVRPMVASAALSFYWIGVIVSRLLASFIGARLGETRILLFGSVIGGAVLLLSVLASSSAVAIAGFLIGGIATGATIPVAMSIAHERLPQRTGQVTSILYGLMVVGRLVGPLAIGSVGDRFGLGAGIIIAAAVLLAAALLSIWVVVSERRFAGPLT